MEFDYDQCLLSEDKSSHLNINYSERGSLRSSVLDNELDQEVQSRQQEEKERRAIKHRKVASLLARSQKKLAQEKLQADKRSGKASFLKMLLIYADPLDMALIFFGFLLAAITGILMPSLAILQGNIIDNFSTDASEIQTVAKDALLMFSVGVMLWAMSALYYIFLQILSFRIARKYRVKYLSQLLQQEVSWFDSSLPSELAQSLSAHSLSIERALGEKAGTVLMSAFQIFASFIYAFWISWPLSLALSCLMPVYFFSTTEISRSIQKGVVANMQGYAQSQGFSEQAISSIRVVQAFSQELTELDSYDQFLQRAREVGARSSLRTSFWIGVDYFFCSALFSYTFSIGTAMIVNGQVNPGSGETYTYGETLQVFLLIVSAVFTISLMIPNLKAVTEGQIAAKQAFKVLEMKTQKPLEEPGSYKIKHPDEIAGRIEFRNVSFAYPSNKNLPVLNRFSAVFEAGKTTAIVGMSGSGKSTLIQLLERYYDPDIGEIFLDKYELKTLNLRSLRKVMGYVSQEPVLFNCTIRENLLMGNSFATEDQIIAALQLANAWNFINAKMRDGLDTHVGHLGGQLSGGQKQRIAIARALLKTPKILLLDEATNALDKKNETKVQEAINKIRKELGSITTIVISHRLQTIKDADKILVVNKGRVVEQGTHQSILQQYPQGIYSQFVAEQDEVHGLEVPIDSGFRSSEIKLSEPLSPIKESEFEDGDFDNIEQQMQSFVEKRGISAFGRDLPTEEQEELERKMHAKADDIQERIEIEVIRHIKESRHSQSIQKRLLGYCEPRRNIYIGLIASAVLGSVAPVIAIFLSKDAFVLNGYLAEEGSSIGHASYMICFEVALLAVVAFGASMIQKHTFGVMGETITVKLRQQLYKSILTKEISWFDKPENAPGVLSGLMARDAAKVRGAAAEAVATQVEASFAILIAVIISIAYSWKIGLISCALIPLMFFGNAIIKRFSRGMHKEVNKLYQESQLLSSDVIANYKTVAALANEDQIVKQFNELLEAPYQRAKRETLTMGAFFGMAKLFQYGCQAFSYYCASLFLQQPGANPFDLYTSLLVTNQGTKQAGMAMVFGPDVGAAKQAAESLFQIIDEPSLINPLYSINKRQIHKSDVRGTIVFKNVWFRYPNRREHWVLRNFNLTIAASSTIGIVGESGCGKSTLLSLLLRFYDVTFGSITIDSVDIRSIQVSHLRSLFGYVPQEFALFNYSIYENVLYGHAEALNSQLVQSCVLANAMEFVERVGDETLMENVEDSFESIRKEFELLQRELEAQVGKEKYWDLLEQLKKFEKEETRHGRFLALLGQIDKRDHSYKDCELGMGFFQECGVRGSRLSGGQKQRLAIARAIVRDPPILLLDEAASALDEESLRKVQKSLEKVMGVKTTIMIAHRLSAIQKCDLVVMIENGRVVEQGTYRELKSRQGKFALLTDEDI